MKCMLLKCYDEFLGIHAFDQENGRGIRPMVVTWLSQLLSYHLKEEKINREMKLNLNICAEKEHPL